jgi:hypothetical protein
MHIREEVNTSKMFQIIFTTPCSRCGGQRVPTGKTDPGEVVIVCANPTIPCTEVLEDPCAAVLSRDGNTLFAETRGSLRRQAYYAQQHVKQLQDEAAAASSAAVAVAEKKKALESKLAALKAAQ